MITVFHNIIDEELITDQQIMEIEALTEHEIEQLKTMHLLPYPIVVQAWTREQYQDCFDSEYIDKALQQIRQDHSKTEAF